MRKNILFLLLALTMAIPAAAQRKKSHIIIEQFVRNSFTKHGIPNARVTLMREDSTVIDTMRTVRGNGSHNAQIWYYNHLERKTQQIIVRVEHPEYITKTETYEVKNYGRNRVWILPELFMKRKPKERHKDLDQMMNEVVVVATKVKVVYKNDTIIYNADAFNVPDGSMLDGLIRQFPGAELKENGEIFINGKKIDYLTLNGKDFMKGNNKIMLENLPYYTVQKVRVFNKSTERSELLGHDVEKKDYVMDVELKKEYSIGYMGNAEAAGGTREKWLGRLFGLRFTDNSRLLVAGSANNINDNKTTDYNGNWGDGTGIDGDLTYRHAIINLIVDDKNGRFKEEATATASWTDHLTESRTARQTFLEAGDAFSRAQATAQDKEMQLRASNRLTLKRIGLRANTYASYSSSNSNGTSREASFNEDPNSFGETTAVLDSMFANTLRPELLSINTNRIMNRSLGETGRLHLQNTVYWDKELPWGDDIGLKFLAQYKHNDDKTFDRYSLEYPRGNGNNDMQNKYAFDKQKEYAYTAKANYGLNFPSRLHFKFSYAYTQSYRSEDMDRHRLDRLGGVWGMGATDDSFGLLPSAYEDMMACRDAQNSYSSGHMTRKHTGVLRIIKHKYDSKAGTNFSFILDMPLEYVSERNHYVRNTLNTTVHNSSWLFKPDLHIEYQNDSWRNTWELNYKSEMTAPDIMQMVDYRDTSDPLAVRLGNPDLKGATLHNVNAKFYRRLRKTEHHLILRIGADFMSNLVANGFTYNRTTGVYTYRPENVNGNWSGKASFDYRGHIDKAKHFTFDNKLGYNYYRHIDLVSEVGSEQSRRSEVHNHVLSESLKLDYNYRKLRVGLRGAVNWNQSQGSESIASNDLNAVDFSYGLTGQYELPLKIQLSTNLTVQSRRGYDEPSMNSDDVVWNASVSRSFLKNKLNLRAEAFDILHQLSQTAYVVNGQGRTETWRRSLPNYFMLHLTWKFNVNPKKK